MIVRSILSWKRAAVIGATLALPAAAAAAPSPSFTLIGHIESFARDGAGGGTMQVSNLTVRLPKNLVMTLPGGYVTVDDFFKGPTVSGAPQAASGVALTDPQPAGAIALPASFEAEIIGNIVNGDYIAGVVRLSQGALHTGAGVIRSIDPTSGEMRIGAPSGAGPMARVILNDPTGVYSLANGQGGKTMAFDHRFAVDPGNASVHARTGFPVCVESLGNAAKCPAGNRIGTQKRYTCGAGAPANADAPVVATCNASFPAPLRVGDYVVYSGVLQPDATAALADKANRYRIAAYALTAELGIYTPLGQDPAYVAIEEAIQGTKGEPFQEIPQEETTRFRIVGFTTDPSRNVEVRILDSDTIGFSFSGPGGLTPENGAQLGRVRNTWPSKDDARAVRRDAQLRIVGGAHAMLASGLTSGVYTAPIGEYIYPEPTSFGVNGMAAPVPFENFCFLARAGSVDTIAGGRPVAKLAPFPDSGHPDSQRIGTGAARVCDTP